MKILKIYIYGYGKLVDQEWNLEDEMFSLFYGENESGKSTLMALLFAVFFGFPSKKENQYIPRNSNNYGGSILIRDLDQREIFIERTSGKYQKGIVHIQFPDGSTGSEHELNQLLKGLDSNTFKGIFHFGLDGLQGINELDPQHLNQYLYDASMTGASELAKLEKQLELEKNRLFKKRGVKPEINALTQELSELEKKIIKWEERLDQYECLQQSIQVKEAALLEQKEEKKRIQEQLRWLDKRITLNPIISEWHAYRQEGKDEENLGFPVDGVRRLEGLNEKIQEADVRLSVEKDRLAELTDKKEISSKELCNDKSIREMKDLEKHHMFYSNLLEDAKSLSVLKEELYCYQRAIEEEWPTIDKQTFEKAQYDPYMLEQYDDMKEKWSRLRTTEDRLIDEEKKKKQELNITEQQWQMESDSLLSDEMLERYKKLENNEDQNFQEKEKELKSEQLKWIKEECKRKEAIGKRNKKLFTTGAILTMLAAIATTINGEYILSVFFFVATIPLVFGLRKPLIDRSLLEQVAHLENEIEIIQEQERTTSINNSLTIDVSRQLNEHHENLRKVNDLGTKMLFIKKQLEDWTQNWMDLQDEWRNLERDIKEWSEAAKLPEGNDILFYGKFLNSLKIWNQKAREIADIRKKEQGILNQISKFEERVMEIAKTFSLSEKASMPSLYREILVILENQQQWKETSLREEEKLVSLNDVISELEKEKHLYVAKVDSLLYQAHVDTEEAFREKGMKAELYNINKSKEKELWVQIVTIVPDESKRVLLIEDIIHRDRDDNEEQKVLSEDVTRIDQETNQLHADLSYQINELKYLEEDGTYEEQKQKYTMIKQKLNDYAKEWVVLETGAMMIEKVKDIYEKERQPKVLKKAQDFFSRLTSEEYTYLFAPIGEKRFVVERNDGQRFEPTQLSRGTCEMLYLSIRLGLALEDSSREQFPLFLDETFVNMDKQRRINVWSLLEEISIERQIFYFSCHEHILNEINDYKAPGFLQAFN
ncbi:ATP-binding protein [Salipaludibacillus neizhouensis]|uniref:ATP-binding protein n=1 Tax=Salipaludibacillus neizhouensis TaxID=885475 RepID=UPI001600FA97|nr:AAA family ATPase [Salipaludibacillus neizhouensis]